MNGLIATAIAHDATCEKGDEWVFHYMSGLKKIDGGKEEGNPSTEEELEDANICCAVFCIMLLVGLGFGIYYLIMH